MDAVIIDPSRKQEWEAYVDNHPYSIAWQSYEWNTVLQKNYNVQFFPVAAEKDSKIVGVLPLYYYKPFRGKGSLISVPFAVAGGIVADNEQAVQCLFEKAKQLSKQFDDCRISFRQYKKKPIDGLTTDENFYNRELDLTQGTEKIWTNLEETNRKNIEESKKHHVTLEHPSHEINAFYEFLLNHQHDTGIPCVSKNWIRNLIAFDMYSVALLKKDNTIVAATMVKQHKKTVSFPFTCLSPKLPESEMFAYCLYWRLIEKFTSDGFEIFHSGRIPYTDEAGPFRLGWGGTKFPYYYVYYPVSRQETEYTGKRGKKREFFQAAWRRMPLFLARILGPYIVRQFP